MDSKLDKPVAVAVDTIVQALGVLYPRRSRAELLLAAHDVVERFARLDSAPDGFFGLTHERQS